MNNEETFNNIVLFLAIAIPLHTRLSITRNNMTNISGKVDNIYSSIITSKHNIESPQKHEETDFSDNCHLIKSQTEVIKNFTRKLEDSQSQQHKEARIMERGGGEVSNQRKYPRQGAAAQTNIGGVKPGTNSVAIQCNILSGLPTRQSSTSRVSAFRRLGPHVPSIPLVPARTTPLVASPVGVAVPEAGTPAIADAVPSVLNREESAVTGEHASTTSAAKPSVFHRMGVAGTSKLKPKSAEPSVSHRAVPVQIKQRVTQGRVYTSESKWYGCTEGQTRLNRRRVRFNQMLRDPQTPRAKLRAAWARASTVAERKEDRRPRHLELLTFAARAVQREKGSETSPPTVRVSIPLESIGAPTPVLPLEPHPPMLSPRKTKVSVIAVHTVASVGGNGAIPVHAPDVSKGAIPRPETTSAYTSVESRIPVKTRVFTRSNVAMTPPRRLFAPWKPPVSRSKPVPSKKPISRYAVDVEAAPTRSQCAADTQVATTSTSTFVLPECPPHLTLAFAAYRASQFKEAMERAVRTGRMETGTPRAELMPWPEPSDVPVRRRTAKRKKRRNKRELRGPNWSEMEVGGRGEPISEDSGLEDIGVFNDQETSDEDVLQLDLDEDL
ncbi:uncharacterized protein LOC141533472 isoform X2 [Cotesia typhae]|uniref:uncharacterized protein LOC141533472 isoform X2 n=1 Tax=Cotesia typhae TaxID=2053667 RepID=UPI003D69C518